jgi:acyl carrier protein
MDAVETQVIEVITGVLQSKNRAVSVDGSSRMGAPTVWDSLAFVEIFLGVSTHFNLEVSDDDAMSFMSVPEIVDFVTARL